MLIAPPEKDALEQKAERLQARDAPKIVYNMHNWKTAHSAMVVFYLRERPTQQPVPLPSGSLRAEDSCAAGDHLQLHERNWNHALVIEAIHEVA